MYNMKHNEIQFFPPILEVQQVLNILKRTFSKEIREKEKLTTKTKEVYPEDGNAHSSMLVSHSIISNYLYTHKS